ncbi:MAG: biotin--[acetyl-CoA-carboxylase] ligase [Rhodospirillales bacterium]|nr:biotin--[acetyl-CoA-carboxylase] ligase [Rhodospirillales bacterium]
MSASLGSIRLPDGFHLAAYDDIDSTNDEARRLAAGGPPPVGLAVIAARQVQGKGRPGRRWVWEPGKLYSSVVLRADTDPAISAQLGFAVALAVRDTLESVGGPFHKVQCKWPNDVLFNGKKIVGILLEYLAGAEAGLGAVIAGCGINVAHHPGDTDRPATSLAAEGVEARIEDVAAGYLAALSAWHSTWLAEGFEPVRQAWLNAGHAPGDPLEVHIGDANLTGAFVGLDPGGALVLDVAGEHRRFAAGDVYSADGQSGV